MQIGWVAIARLQNGNLSVKTGRSHPYLPSVGLKVLFFTIHCFFALRKRNLGHSIRLRIWNKAGDACFEK